MVRGRVGELFPAGLELRMPAQPKECCTEVGARPDRLRPPDDGNRADRWRRVQPHC